MPADIGVLSDKAVVLGETTNGIHCNIMGDICYPHASEDASLTVSMTFDTYTIFKKVWSHYDTDSLKWFTLFVVRCHTAVHGISLYPAVTSLLT